MNSCERLKNRAMQKISEQNKRIAELEQRLAAAESKIAETEALPDWAKVGDGTLHSAIDHWQAKAAELEQRLAAAEFRNAELESAVKVYRENFLSRLINYVSPVMEEINRAKEILKVAAIYIEKYPDFIVEYDETECDGYCLAEDCRIAADMLEKGNAPGGEG